MKKQKLNMKKQKLRLQTGIKKRAISKIVALFLISLIIALPLYSSIAFAGLDSVKIYGNAQKDGYLKAYDDTFFAEVIASMPDHSEVGTGQVKVGSAPLECSAYNLPMYQYKCTYSQPFNDVTAMSYDLSVTLYDKQSRPVQTATKTVVLDENAPVINSFELIPQIANSASGITARLKASDTACNDLSCSGKCSGIAKAVIFASDNPETIIATKDFDSGSCSAASDITIPVPATDGLYSVCAKVIDGIGRESTSRKCASTKADNTLPQITNFTIMRDGVAIGYTGISDTLVDVSVKITDANGINATLVTGQFSELNPEYSTPKQAVCIQDSNAYLCSWSGLTIPASTADKKGKITITAQDLAGNNVSSQFQFDLKIDTEKPNAEFFGTTTLFKDKSFIKRQHNTFVAKIKETKSGFAAKDIYANLHAINPAYPSSGTQASDCKQESGYWNCYWNGISSTLIDGVQAAVTLRGSDDAGNALEGTLQTSVKMDSAAPVAGSFYSYCKSELGSFSYCKADDELHIEVQVQDATQVKAIADLSAVYPGVNAKEGVCESQVTGAYTCKWDITDMKIPQGGHRTLKAKLNFSDSVGNELLQEGEIIILEDIDEENPDFWQVNSIESMPAAVDRQTTTLMPQGVKVFVHAKLAPKADSGDLQILKLDLKECRGDTREITGGKPLFFNNEVGDKTDPYFKFVLAKKDFKNINELNFECNMTIYSRYMNGFTKNPETETVPIKIIFYNLPVGELSQSIKDEIQNARNSPIVQNRMVGSLSKIMQSLEKICQVNYLLGSVNTALLSFGEIAGGAGNIPILGQLSAFTHKLDGNLGTTSGARGPDKNPEGTGATGTDSGANVNVNKGGLSLGFSGLGTMCAYLSCSGGTKGGYGIWGNWYGDFIRKDKIFGVEWAKMKFGCTTPIGSEQSPLKAESLGGDKCGALILPESPKDSMILSMATGCIPGIIYNMQKQRQIECAYILCLESVKDGMPATVCREQKAYQTCQYTIGQMFQLVPFGSFFQGLLKQFYTVMSNPIGMVFGIAQFSGCPWDVDSSNIAAEKLTGMCRMARTAAIMGRLLTFIDNFKNMPKDFGSKDLCDDVLKNQKRRR